MYVDMSVAIALGALLVVLAAAFVTLYIETMKKPDFAEKMPGWWVKFVTGKDKQTADDKEEKKQEVEHATLVSSTVSEAIKAGSAFDVEKWKRAVHASLSAHLEGLRQKGDGLKPGSSERVKANEDVNDFKPMVDAIEIKFTKDLKENPQVAMSNMLTMLLPVEADKALIRSTMASPETWVKADGATNVLSNYILTAYY
eukprot:jgi/Mesvir1/26918/Mv20645-RA.1